MLRWWTYPQRVSLSATASARRLLIHPTVTAIARISARILPVWLCVGLFACQTASTKGPPDELLASGENAYQAKNYKLAAKYFSAIRLKHPESPEDEKASFLFAESNRLLRSGSPSFKAYKDFAKRYPNSRYSVAVAEGEYKLGVAYFEKTLSGFLFFTYPLWLSLLP